MGWQADQGRHGTGVTQIDAFLDSHYHEDHFGEIDDRKNLNVPILESYDRGRRDLVPASEIWSLVGSLAPGQSQNFRRGGQPMTLNNAGDEITLLDPSGTERDRFA